MKVNRCIHCMEEMGENAAICPHCAARQETPELYSGLQPNSILHGRYLVGLLLEEWGDTYIAFDLARGERVSIKEFFPFSKFERKGADRRQWDRGFYEFLQVGNSLHWLEGITMPRAREVFEANGTAYIVLDSPMMPQGAALASYVEKNGPLDYVSCVHSLLPVADDLVRMHQDRVFHGQIDPRHIRVEKACPEDRWNGVFLTLSLSCPYTMNDAYILDYAPWSTAVLMPPNPFAPLENKSHRGPWSDVYALCAVLYFCLTGRAPDRFETDKISDQLKKCAVPSLSRKQLDVVTEGMALFFSEDRIPSMDDLVLRLEKSLEAPGEENPAHNPHPLEYTPTTEIREAAYVCPQCSLHWKSPAAQGKPSFCPYCGSKLDESGWKT